MHLTIEKPMSAKSPFNKLLSLAKAHDPEANFDFLNEAIYRRSLSTEEKQACTQLITLARTQQAENPVYEPVYQQLLHLYVLNGSRLDILRRVERRLRGLAANQGGLMLVAGNSGIGKTSLIMALQRRIEQVGSQLLVVRSSEEESEPYSLWQEIGRRVAAITGDAFEDVLTAVGNGRSVTSAQHLVHALANWLEKTLATHPLVILLDDLHWADEDSLVALDRLTSRDRQLPLLFIGTYRNEESHFGNPFYDYWPKLMRNRPFDQIRLDPLTEEDVVRLAESYLGACSPQLSAYLFARATGHPLFTAELLHSLVEQAYLRQDDAGRWLPPEASVPVPAVMKQLIIQRVQRLGDDVAEVLGIAAVVGERWPLAIVEQLSKLPEDKLLATLKLALKAGLVVVEADSSEVYRFAHGLTKEVLYKRQWARHRKERHRQIAAEIKQQQPGNLFAIAHHCIEGEQWDEAMEQCLAAGDEAVQQFAFHSALHWYQQALHAANHLRNTPAQADYVTIYNRLGRTYQAVEQHREAEIVYGRARDDAQSKGDFVAEGHALVDLAHTRISQYQLEIAEKTASEALKIGEQTDDLRLISRIHTCLALLNLYRGQLEPASQHLDHVNLHLETLDDFALKSEIFKQRAYLKLWTGDYREAETNAQSTLDYAQEAVDALVKVSGYQNLGWAQIEMGSYREAYQNLRTAIEAGDISEAEHHNLPRLLNLMGYLYLELGDAQEALVWDKKALAATGTAQGHSNYEMWRYSLLNMATDYLHLGKVDEAQETIARFDAIKEAAESLRFRYFNRYQLLLSELHLVQQAPEQAIEMAQEARRMAEANGDVKERAQVSLVRRDRPSPRGCVFQEAVATPGKGRYPCRRYPARLLAVESSTEPGRRAAKGRPIGRGNDSAGTGVDRSDHPVSVRIPSPGHFSLIALAQRHGNAGASSRT
jgi:tetratricopeptide (TPR) repeat protein